MNIKEILFNIIVPSITGFIGGTISTTVIMKKNVKKHIMKNKNINIVDGDMINGNKN